MATRYTGQISICLYRNYVTDLVKLLEMARKMHFDCIICPVSHQHIYRKTNSIRPDVVCSASEWAQMIFMKLSDEIDCDSKDESIRKHSERTFIREMQATDYLAGHGCVVMKLKSRESINLAKTLLSQLSYERRVLMQVPWMNIQEDVQSLRQNPSQVVESSWNYWNRFRLNCDFHPSIGILLEITEKMPSNMEINRWLAEPVDMILISAKFFESNGNRDVVLSEPIRKIVEKFVLHLNVHVAIEAGDDPSLELCSNYIQKLKKTIENWPNKDMVAIFQDQPKEIYINFQEKTSNISKLVNAYEAAFGRALKNIKETDIKVMLFGAGVINLIKIFLNVWQNSKKTLKLFVYEKDNSKIPVIHHYLQHIETFSVNEIIIIKGRYEREYRYSVHIIATLPFESTYLNQQMQNDFKNLEYYLHSNGVIIPEKTTLSIAPIMSQKILNKIRMGNDFYIEDKNINLSTYKRRVNRMYSVTPRNFQRISQEMLAFSFNNYPSVESLQDNIASMEFPIDYDCILTGFVGYFAAKLFEDIELDTRKMEEYSDILCPKINLYPIKNIHYVKKGEKLSVTFHQNVDRNTMKTWSEWSVEEPFIIPAHNSMGLYDNKTII